MKTTIKKLLLVFFLILIYVYVLAIESIPDKLVIFEGENITMKTLILGMNIKTKSKTIETVSNNKTISKKSGQAKLQVNLIGNIAIKDVDIDILEKTRVIPVGSIAGVKLYTSGVLVVGMSEIEGIDNKMYKPYENSGIKEGDTITQVNNINITSTEELIETVNKAKGEKVKIKYIQSEQTKECSIEPVQTSSNEYKLGLWVRDSAARSRYSNVL